MSREEEGNPPGLSSLDWIHAILRARGMQNRYSIGMERLWLFVVQSTAETEYRVFLTNSRGRG